MRRKNLTWRSWQRIAGGLGPQQAAWEQHEKEEKKKADLIIIIVILLLYIYSSGYGKKINTYTWNLGSYCCFLFGSFSAVLDRRGA
ncbi:MAG: hypothetical protein LBK18_05205 [Prevotellaceae bacterium]|nr:hypothetical protein [Prevotellaceae bacterium]